MHNTDNADRAVTESIGVNSAPLNGTEKIGSFGKLKKKQKNPRKSGRCTKACRIFWMLVLLWIIAYCINWYIVERRLYAPTKWGACHKLAVFTYYETTGYKEPFDNTFFAKWIRAEFNKATECNIPSISTRYTEKTTYGNKLLSLDRRYGHIPEYWEMRPAGSGMSRSDCLKRACEMSHDRPDIIYYRACAEYDEIRQDNDNPAGTNPGYDELVLDAAREASFLEPENGAWNFLMGVELNNLGRWDESVGQFRIAANADTFRLPLLFPESEYLDTMYDLRTNPEVAAFGIGYLDCVSFPGFHITLASKTAYKNALVSIATNNDMEALAHMYMCGVRMACGDVEEVNKGAVTDYGIYSLVGVNLAGTLTEWYVDEHGAGLSGQDRLAFDCLKEWRIMGASKYRTAPETVFNSFGFLAWNSSGNIYRTFAERPDIVMFPTEEKNLIAGQNFNCSRIFHNWIIRDEVARRKCDTCALDTIIMSKQNVIDFAPLSEFDFNEPATSMKRVLAKADELRRSRLDTMSAKSEQMNAETTESEKTE